MAKELPYFQFEPAQYLTGNIQFCSMEEQGIFINVCSIYWQRNCSANKDQLIRKFNADNIHRLIAEGVIKCSVSGEIIIEFLDEQFKEISRRKELCSKGGKKSAASKKATTLQDSYKVVDRPFQHLDKIKEDKIKEENTKYQRPLFFLKQQNEIEFEQIEMKSGLKDFQECLEQWSLSVEGSDFKYSENKSEDYRKLKARFEKWINSWRTNKAEKDKPKPEKIPDLVKQGKAKIVNGLIKPIDWQP